MKTLLRISTLALATLFLLVPTYATWVPLPEPGGIDTCSGSPLTAAQTFPTCVSNQPSTSSSFYVAGYCYVTANSWLHACVWSGPGMTGQILPNPYGCSPGHYRVNGVNSYGLAVGSYSQACYWQWNGASYQVYTLQGILGGTSTTANGVNDSGVIVGSSGSYPCFWAPDIYGNYGAATPIGPMGTLTGSANCINSYGWIGVACNFPPDSLGRVPGAGYYNQNWTVGTWPVALPMPSYSPLNKYGYGVSGMSNSTTPYMVGHMLGNSKVAPTGFYFDYATGACNATGNGSGKNLGANGSYTVGTNTVFGDTYATWGSNYSSPMDADYNYFKLAAINDYGIVVGNDITNSAGYFTSPPY